MEMNHVNGKWILIGLVCTFLGLALCATPIAIVGMIMIPIGCILMFVMGSTGGGYRAVSLYQDSHDSHLHLHQHEHYYPRQKVSEGTEYAVTDPDGTIRSMRQIRRSE